MSPSTPSLDLDATAAHLAELLALQPGELDGAGHWFEEVEIHLLAVRAILDQHATLDEPARQQLLWDAPRIAPLLRRLDADSHRLRELTAFALAAVRSPERTPTEVRHVCTELVRRIGHHRSRQDGVYHEAFAVDIGGPG